MVVERKVMVLHHKERLTQRVGNALRRPPLWPQASEYSVRVDVEQAIRASFDEAYECKLQAARDAAALVA